MIRRTRACIRFRVRSVPVPGTPTSSIEVKDKDAAFKLINPVPITERSVDMGHRLFSIYCVPCHGKSGTGDGYVGAETDIAALESDLQAIPSIPGIRRIIRMVTFSA